MTEGLPYNTLNCVSVYRSPEVTFGHDNTKSGMIAIVFLNPYSHRTSANPKIAIVEDLIKLMFFGKSVEFLKSGRTREHLHRQTLSTFGSSGIYNFTAAFCGHSRPEAMGTFAFYYAGLKCAFHGQLPDPEKGERDCKERCISCQSITGKANVGFL